MKNIFRSFKQKVAATVLSLAAVAGLASFGVIALQGQAAAVSQPNFEVTMRVNDINATPVKEVNNLKAGDTVHVYVTAFNPAPENNIDRLQIYAPFSHRGILAWVKADNLDRIGLSYVPKFNLSTNLHLQYVANSTKTATNQSGSVVISDVADAGAGQSKVFNNSQDPNVGFFWENVTGGQNQNQEDVQYTVKYELKVVEGNPAAFNQHGSDAPTFMVRKQGENEWRNSVNDLKPGDKLEFRVYVHNNTRGTIAMNTKVGVENWPTSTGKSFDITGFVDADNAERARNSVTITDDQDFRLNYVANSTRFMGTPSLTAGQLDNSQVRPEGVITANGVTIGEGDVGAVDGCFDFVVYAFFVAEVEGGSTSTPTPTPTPTPPPGKERSCFEARVFEDLNGNGRYDAGEPGLSWEIDWRRDNDQLWTEYVTYSDKDGMGGRVCVDDEPDITTRLRVKDWCKPTTATEQKGKLELNKTKYFEFGCARTKPGVQKGTPVKQLPKTGSAGEILVGLSVSFTALGAGLTLARRRLMN
jgi:hypothetical protein